MISDTTLPNAASVAPSSPNLLDLMTRERWIEVARIVVCGLVALLYWKALVPIELLWAAVALGLYPLVKTGVLDLIHEHKVGTEIFVTIATLVAVFGGETVAGAVLMVIILIAEFIAELNTDRARASIKSLIGSVPQVALVKRSDGERTVPIGELKIGDVVLVHPATTLSEQANEVEGDAHQSPASKALCLDACDERTHYLPKQDSSLDPPDLAPLTVFAVVWIVSQPIASAVRVEPDNHADPFGIPIRLRYSRLTL